jgi:hypothetical protein
VTGRQHYSSGNNGGHGIVWVFAALVAAFALCMMAGRFL